MHYFLRTELHVSLLPLKPYEPDAAAALRQIVFLVRA
jgi:hypothetical protein